jgi:hypothetical protein
LAKSIEPVINDLIHNELKNVNTCAPAIIEEVTDGVATCIVKVAIKTEDGQEIDKLEDVPILGLGFGEFYISNTPKKDDECLLVFSHRNTGEWVQDGGVQDQRKDILFPVGSCFVISGLRSLANKFKNYIDEGLVLSNKDGSSKIELTNDSIKIDSPSVMINGVDFSSHTHTITSGSSVGETMPPTGA